MVTVKRVALQWQSPEYETFSAASEPVDIIELERDRACDVLVGFIRS